MVLLEWYFNQGLIFCDGWAHTWVYMMYTLNDTVLAHYMTTS